MWHTVRVLVALFVYRMGFYRGICPKNITEEDKLTHVGHDGHLRTRMLSLHAKAKKVVSSSDKTSARENNSGSSAGRIAVPNLLKAFKEGTLEKVGSEQAGEEEDERYGSI